MSARDDIHAEVQNLRSQERDEQDHVNRAARADAILTDPLVVEAFASLEQQIDKARKNTARGDVATREYLHDLWIHLSDFKAVFAQQLRTGTAAEFNIRSLQSRREFQERRLRFAKT